MNMKSFTVRELIEKLLKFDMNTPVYVALNPATFVPILSNPVLEENVTNCYDSSIVAHKAVIL